MGQVNAGTADEVQYEDLYHAHYGRVVRLCRLLLEDRHEAEDVAQEVFLKLHRASQAEGRVMAWGPWLTRVALNACRDRRRSAWWKWWRRTRAIEPADESQEIDPPSLGPTPEEAMLGREVREHIWSAYRALPPRQQEVFVLRYVEEWSTDAIATALGVSSGTVKQHLFRAVHRLRSAIGEES
jgi:RNA polymerase sigma-70 factor (ECF subfamily)